MARGNVANKDWEEHWKDMPEFVQPAQKPYALINVRFDSKEALDAFSALIGQNLNSKTKAIRYPKKEESEVTNLVYVYES